ncbi:MAG: hypothetical protein K0Q73_6683 [Paenibacillus sp.]|jgi:hypothetical protein|nr:hypothetical protein [Paenibacillus sp.]
MRVKSARILHAALEVSLPCRGGSMPSHSFVTPVQGVEAGLSNGKSKLAITKIITLIYGMV